VIGYSLLATPGQWLLQGPGGPVTVKTKPRLWTNNGDTSVAAAVRGAGIDLQPTFLIADELASGRLVQVLPGWQAAELGIYAVYPSRKFVLPKVRALWWIFWRGRLPMRLGPGRAGLRVKSRRASLRRQPRVADDGCEFAHFVFQPFLRLAAAHEK
jgi:hypothetical protein